MVRNFLSVRNTHCSPVEDPTLGPSMLGGSEGPVSSVQGDPLSLAPEIMCTHPHTHIKKILRGAPCMRHQVPTASPTSLDHSTCQMLAEAQTAQTCRNDLTWEVPQLHTLCGWTAGKRQPWHTDLGNTAAWQRLPRPTATHYSQLKGGKKGGGTSKEVYLS